ncbi:MAG: LPS export ABC transporter periplasmic protein LptC [Ignavibacteriales bacterium]|nr:LPS export ABC transporter periplasmic protein LptC [Ignavibacteriales bacterium]
MRSVWLMWACVALIGCEEKIKPSVLSTVDSRTLPQQESWNSRIVISDSGRVRAVVNAGYLRVFENSNLTHLSEGVTAHFFDREGQQTSVMTSSEGTVDETTNNLEAWGNVLVVSTDSTKLRSEKLYWDNVRQLIHTPEFVRIVSPKEKLQGHGLESDQSLKNYRIFRVTGEAQTE